MPAALLADFRCDGERVILAGEALLRRGFVLEYVSRWTATWSASSS